MAADLAAMLVHSDSGRPSPKQVVAAPTVSPRTPAARRSDVLPASHVAGTHRGHQGKGKPRHGRVVNCRVQKCIAMTFDDGPGPYTHRLLKELAAKHAHATFFLIGRNVAARPWVVRREVRNGNAVGNHTWSHPDLTHLAAMDVAREIDRTARAIKRAAHVTTDLVRPPYEATNKRVQSVLRQRGDTEILWSVDTEDWRNRSVAVTTRRAVSDATRGAIILMHDIHPTTVAAVPRIIHRLRARGYLLVTVPQLLGHIEPGRKYFTQPTR